MWNGFNKIKWIKLLNDYIINYVHKHLIESLTIKILLIFLYLIIGEVLANFNFKWKVWRFSKINKKSVVNSLVSK